MAIRFEDSMHAHRLKLIATCTCGAALCCAALPARGASADRGKVTLGAAIEGGRVFVDSRIPSELDKDGAIKAYKAFLEYHADRFSLALNGGFESAETAGRDEVRAVSQAASVKAAGIGVGVYANLGYSMQLGIDVRQHRGPGADYGIYREPKDRVMTDLGPALRVYAPFLTSYLLRAEFSALTSSNADLRRVSTLTAGLSMSIPVPFIEYPRLRLSAKPSPRLEDEVLLFDYASDEIADEDMSDITEFAGRWRRQDFSSRKIVVSGHASRAGYTRTNLRVSLRRALNVARVLIENGVPHDALELSGFGYSKLLDSVPPVYDEQRRVEVRVMRREAFDYAKTPSKSLTTSQLSRFAKILKGKNPKSYLVRVSIPSVATRSDRDWRRVENYLEILVREGVPADRIVTRTEIRDGDVAFNIANLDGESHGVQP